MMKIRKADFDGYGIDYIRKNIDLRAIALTKYRLVNENVFETGKPMFSTAVPIELDIYSKISAVQSDFSVKDIVSVSNYELAVCACNEHSIIYCEKRENLIYKSSSSENVYISSSGSISYECYDDIFVIEESDDLGSKKVTAFDMDLHIISSSIMACSDINEYEIDKLNKQSAFNNYTGELRETYPDLSIDFNFNAFNEASHYLIAACYDRQTQKEYIVKFNKSKEIAWKIEMSGNFTTDNILVLKNCFYVLYFTGRVHKWRLTKFTNDGQPLDNYDFTGGDARLTLYSKKPVIVFTDISKFTPWQKRLAKISDGSIGPAAMLVID